MIRILLLLAVAAPALAQPVKDPHAAAAGTWRIPAGARARKHPTTIEMPGIERFGYDGKHVTVTLVSEKAWMWRRPDDTYRLESRWVGDELQYRPPFGTWNGLATYRDGRFESKGTTAPWLFERVTDAMMDKDDRVLVAPRPVHDYSIKPMDRYKP